MPKSKGILQDIMPPCRRPRDDNVRTAVRLAEDMTLYYMVDSNHRHCPTVSLVVPLHLLYILPLRLVSHLH
jgi:hypothetical protein